MPAITEEEYSTWLSPHTAVETLKAVGYTEASASQSILFRVLDEDGIRAAADKLTVDPVGGTENKYRFEILAPRMWEIAAIQESFWDSGDAIFRRRHEARGADIAYVCIGIRFDPAGLEKLASQRRTPTPDTRSTYDRAADAVTTALQNLHNKLPSADEAEPLIDPFIEGAPGLTTSEMLRYFQRPAQDPGFTEEEFAELTKRMSRRRGEGPYETASKPARRVAPPYRAGVAAAPPDKPKKVTKDELRQWFPTYQEGHSDFRAEAVQSAALLHFEPRPVTRQPVREIIAEFDRTLTRGKPTGI